MPSTDNIAIIAAVSGLVGVVLGAIVTGGFQVFLDWRANKRAIQRAKRLVTSELLQARIIVRSLYGIRRWPYTTELLALLSTDVWKQQSSYLSSLRESLWTDLVLTYSEFTTMRVILVDYTSTSNSGPIPTDILERMKAMDEHIGTICKRLGAREVTVLDTPLPDMPADSPSATS
jgi:hypothetical protein